MQTLIKLSIRFSHWNRLAGVIVVHNIWYSCRNRALCKCSTLFGRRSREDESKKKIRKSEKRMNWNEYRLPNNGMRMKKTDSKKFVRIMNENTFSWFYWLAKFAWRFVRIKSFEYVRHELNDEIRYSIILPDFVYFRRTYHYISTNDFNVRRADALANSVSVACATHAFDCSWQIDNQSILCANIEYHTYGMHTCTRW